MRCTQHDGAVASFRASWSHCMTNNNSRELQGLSCDCAACQQKPSMPSWGSQGRKMSEGLSFHLLLLAAAWASGLFKNQSLPIFAQGPHMGVGAAGTKASCSPESFLFLPKWSRAPGQEIPRGSKVPRQPMGKELFPLSQLLSESLHPLLPQVGGRGLAPSVGPESHVFHIHPGAFCSPPQASLAGSLR